VGQLIQFEERAVARLRERLGLVEEANEDLIAFARGHSDAVASIHSAVLAAVEAATIESLLDVVTRDWPVMLGIDAVAIALTVRHKGFRADAFGIERVEAAFVRRMLDGLEPVEVRSVAAGHRLFGSPAAERIRAQALIRIESERPFPCGLLALGQEAELTIETSHGSELLLFLGRIIAAAVRRCVATS
jgi:uncharacterized protein YigA (DUF484 family)